MMRPRAIRQAGLLQWHRPFRSALSLPQYYSLHDHRRPYSDEKKSRLPTLDDLKELTAYLSEAALSSTKPAAAAAATANGTPDAFTRALSNNKSWAASLKAANPAYLPQLAKSQAPKILWIGCSDSRVPAETITGLQPGELFVHRNIANVVNPTDLSSLSVIEYATQALKVDHIVLCGHHGCGGVGAALANKKLGKIDTWLMQIRHVRMRHLKELEALESDAERSNKLVDLNVRHGIEILRENPDVVQAQTERGLQVHGVVYDIASGELVVLDVADEVAASRKAAFELS